eukprot:CAMPEP_0177638642 /NCGR_PEP_ID=MMETSP0447-20121125/5601_1 /TAXON_ID=0 /ORGANISM="Stygamoeba regulata, Strain BSH-02190019" /LENGTH=753 /DNA_ID=CAMNT_0019140625 /DNA_START=212 /DNA_END=2470 /DNA_ORIENTATION=+
MLGAGRTAESRSLERGGSAKQHDQVSHLRKGGRAADKAGSEDRSASSVPALATTVSWGVRGMLADLLVGLTFWNVTTMFPDTIFYFPLFKMAISGYELACTVQLIALVCAFASSRTRFVLTTHQPVFHFISIVGFASFYCGPAAKIMILAVAESFGGLCIWSALTSNRQRRYRAMFGLVLSLVALVCCKMAYISLNPFWYNQFNNTIGILLAVLGGLLLILDGAYKNALVKTIDGIEQLGPRVHGLIPLSIGYGSMWMITRWMSTAHGVVARWVDVYPFPAGILCILATLIGLLLSRHPIVTTRIWACLAVLGAIGLYFVSGPLGFLGGVLLLGVTASSWLAYTDRVCDFIQVHPNSLWKLLTLAHAWVLLLEVLTVWVVAYNFVPGGTVTRERVYLVLFAATFGLCWVNMDGFNQHRAQSERRSWIPRREVLITAGLIVVLLLAPASVYRAQRQSGTPEPSPEIDGFFTAMIWTIHFGYDNYGEGNFDMVLDMIHRVGRPEIIGLLETDLTRLFTGNRDLMEYLSESLHYYEDYGPPTRDNTWGCGLLSYYPIERAERYLMPSPTGELAPLIDATVNINGTLVDVLVAHFGNFEDTEDRRLQSELVHNVTTSKDSDRPTIFLGYVVARPSHENVRKFYQAGFLDSAPHYYDRWCEYIFYKNVLLHEFSNESVGRISDTEWQKGYFQLSQFGDPAKLAQLDQLVDKYRMIGENNAAAKDHVALDSDLNEPPTILLTLTCILTKLMANGENALA